MPGTVPLFAGFVYIFYVNKCPNFDFSEPIRSSMMNQP